MDGVPDAFVDRYAPVFGGEDGLQAELETPIKPAVRANALRAPDPEDLIDDLEERGVVTDPVPWWPRAGFTDPQARVGNLPEHSLGRLYGMGAASLLPALALDPEPGDAVLEIAAAPGSKAGLLAELMGNEGLLTANDANEGRAYKLVSNLQRLGVRNACVTIHDGRNYPTNPLDRDEPGYDHLLVDAPCSSLGQATPDWVPRYWEPETVAGLTGLQRGLARRAAQLLRPGGTLVYSTCTFAPPENEGVVDWLLDHHPLEPVDHGLPLDGADPVEAFHGETYGPASREALRVHRTQHVTEAFFVARLRKDEAASLGGADQPAPTGGGER
jgi:NOL1/NOP2/sun family putative RNA methylase